MTKGCIRHGFCAATKDIRCSVNMAWAEETSLRLHWDFGNSLWVYQLNKANEKRKYWIRCTDMSVVIVRDVLKRQSRRRSDQHLIFYLCPFLCFAQNCHWWFKFSIGELSLFCKFSEQRSWQNVLSKKVVRTEKEDHIQSIFTTWVHNSVMQCLQGLI